MKVPIERLIYSATIPPTKQFIKSIENYDKIMPVVVTPQGDNFLVHIGNRSVAALKSLGKTEVECVISDLEGPVLALLGNLQRSENSIADAEAIVELMESGWSKEDIVENLGIPMYKIYPLLNLHNNLIPELKQKIADGTMAVEAGRLATKLPKDKQLELSENEKITIAAAQSAKRSEQLMLLDLDSITIPITF